MNFITLCVLFALGFQTLLKGTKNWFIVLCAGIVFFTRELHLAAFFLFMTYIFFLEIDRGYDYYPPTVSMKNLTELREFAESQVRLLSNFVLQKSV